MDERRILCIITHFGDKLLTWNCVASVLQNQTVDILIVDNDAQQNFAILKQYRDRVRMIKTTGKAGFAAANNLGVQAARQKNHYAVLLLNNDTVVVDNAIDQLSSLLADVKVGAVGPCMPYLVHPEKVWACGGFVDRLKVQIGPLRNRNGGSPFEVDYLPGAAILCRLDLWDKVGGLPEKYFLGYEEAELAMKIRALGFRIMVNPEAIILHKVGMSSERRPKYEYNSIRNRMKFGRCIWGSILGTCLVMALTLSESIVKQRRISIWIHAMMDEFTRIPLDYDCLSRIALKYNGIA